ncbi:MAG: restriction endonuclease subunit S [Syntrophomonadaceae bacterium]
MGVPHLFQKDIKKFTILVPPILEQQSIADYLDRKCNKIDDIISIKQTLIDKLSKYKKSLIYECVTGKREVV